MRDSIFVCVLIALLVAFGGSLAKGDLLQINNSQSSLADGGDTDPSMIGTGYHFSIVTLPVAPNTTDTFATASNGVASSIFNVSDSNFDIAFTQTKAEQTTDFEDSLESTGTIYFTPIVNVDYSASGICAFSDDQTFYQTGHSFDLYIALTQIDSLGNTVGEPLFLSNQLSFSSGQCTLAGDPNLVGNLTGFLTPGDNYEYQYSVVVDGGGLASDNSVSGQGSIDLSFSLPEPACFTTLATMLASLCLLRRRAGT